MRFIIGPGKATGDPFDYQTKVVGMKFIDDDLYLLTTRKPIAGLGIVNLEKITFSGQRQVDIGSDGTSSAFRCGLDRRMTETDITDAATAGGYTAFAHESGNFEIRLPITVSESEASGVRINTRLVSRKGVHSSIGLEGEQFTHTIFEATHTGTRSVVSIPDPAAALFALNSAGLFKFYFGESYEMLYEFTEPTLRERKPDGGVGDIKTGRYQLLRGTLAYEDSGYFTLDVAPKLHSDGDPLVDRDTRTHTLPVLEVGMGRSKVGSVNIRDGTMIFGIYSKPEIVRLILKNDSPYPCNPKSLEIEANYSRRSKMSTY
jgi:hypothetical protein